MASLLAAALHWSPRVCSPSCFMFSWASMKSLNYYTFLQKSREIVNIQKSFRGFTLHAFCCTFSVTGFSELRQVNPSSRCLPAEGKSSTFQTDFINKWLWLRVRQDNVKFGFLHQSWLPAVMCQVKQEQVIVLNPNIGLPADILY